MGLDLKVILINHNTKLDRERSGRETIDAWHFMLFLSGAISQQSHASKASQLPRGQAMQHVREGGALQTAQEYGAAGKARAT